MFYTGFITIYLYFNRHNNIMSNKIFLLLSLFLVILSINAVNAEECSLSDLQVLIDNSSDTVNLDCDYAFVQMDSNGGVSVFDKDIKIYGNNHTIDGSNSSTLFEIKFSNVYMENINFLNAGNSALRIYDSNFVIKNCTFINNRAFDGGGIYIEGSSPGLIDNSLFLNNSGYQGSAISMYFWGNNELTISNSIFNNNSAPLILDADGDGNAHLFSIDNLLDNQMFYSECYRYGMPGNISFVNVTYNDFKNHSFKIKKGDTINSGIANKTILFELFDKNDKLLINTTNITNQNGIATVDYSTLELGNYTLKVSYSNLSDTKEIMLRKEINFTMSVEDIFYGDDLTVKYNINNELTGIGELSIWYNDSYYVPYDPEEFNFHEPSYSMPFYLNESFITVPFLPEGNHLIFLEYLGDNIHRPKIINQSFNVYPFGNNLTGNKAVIHAPDIEKYFGGDERLIINFTDENNNSLANKNLSIKINGVTYNRTTNSNGQVSMAINLKPDYYQYLVSFDGDEVYSPSREIMEIHIHPTIVGSGYSMIYCRVQPDNYYEVTCYDSKGNPLTEGEVEFNINGVFYKRAINSEGKSRLNINLDPGTYTITSVNLQNGDTISSELNVRPTIIQNYDLVKYYRNDSQFSVQVDGVWPYDNHVVTFNINGVFYQRVSDENGIAKLNINLAPGEYIITSEFNGCRVSNKITVLPILKAADMKMSYRDGSTFNATLIDGNGNPLANTNVTFNINGVFYQRTTDENGIARLNINLMKGEYIITSSYNGSNIANKITIV